MIEQNDSNSFTVNHPRFEGQTFETRRAAELAVLSDVAVLFDSMIATCERMIAFEEKILARYAAKKAQVSA